MHEYAYAVVKKGDKILFGRCVCAIMKHLYYTTVISGKEPADLMVLCKDPLQLTLHHHLDYPASFEGKVPRFSEY